MDYKKLILIDHLIKTVLNNYNETEYELILRIDSDYYTGQFFKLDKYNQEYVFRKESFWGLEPSTSIFYINNVNMKQDIRTSFFEFAFGKNFELGERTFNTYINNPAVAFVDIVKFANQYEAEFLNPEIDFPNCIYNLTNIRSKESFDFYLLSDEVATPVSLRLVEKK